MDRSDWLQLLGTASIALYVVGLVVVFYAVRFRIWWLAAVATVLSLPFCFLAQIPLFLHWLIPCLQLAIAIALRWRVRAGGALGLLLLGVIVGLVSGPGIFLVHRDLVWAFPAGLLAGFTALLWRQPSWERTERHSDGS